MGPTENQIIVYQPNGVMKIDVRFDGETVWLLQGQIAELFSCSLENVRLHLKNIQQKQDQGLTVAQIMSSLLPNSDLN